jgi:hypothetical protein
MELLLSFNVILTITNAIKVKTYLQTAQNDFQL